MQCFSEYSEVICRLLDEQNVQHKKQCELDNLVTILCEQNAQLLKRVTDLENEREKREQLIKPEAVQENSDLCRKLSLLVRNASCQDKLLKILLERVTDLENERQKREVFTEKILLPAIAKFVAQTDPELLDQIGLRSVFESLKE